MQEALLANRVSHLDYYGYAIDGVDIVLVSSTESVQNSH